MIEVTKENYNPRQTYYFVDYTLWEQGHPENIEREKKKDPTFSGVGHPRWIRESMQTEQDVQEVLNFVFYPFPHRVTNLKIRSEEELNEVITIDEKTNERIYERDDEDAFKKGLKLTQREFKFGGNYQFLYEHTTGVIDDDGKPIKKQKKKSKKVS